MPRRRSRRYTSTSRANPSLYRCTLTALRSSGDKYTKRLIPQPSLSSGAVVPKYRLAISAAVRWFISMSQLVSHSADVQMWLDCGEHGRVDLNRITPKSVVAKEARE